MARGSSAVNSRDRNFTGAKLRRDLAASQERLASGTCNRWMRSDAADICRCEPQQGAGAGSGTEDCGAARAPSASRNAPVRLLQESGDCTALKADRPRRQGDAQRHWRGSGAYNVQIVGGHEAQADCRSSRCIVRFPISGCWPRQARAARTSLGVVADRGGWLTRDTSRSRTSPGARRRGSRRMCFEAHTA